ncbi:hypothetical protein [Chryseobacterium proteolyticum]
MAKIYRDAGNGRFVKKEEVTKRPGTTVTETVKPKPQNPPKKK